MLITSHRLTNGQHELRNQEGTVVGRAWRWPHKSKGYGLNLTGVYWRGESFNTRSGFTSTSCQSLGHCRDKASTVLDWLKSQQ